MRDPRPCILSFLLFIQWKYTLFPSCSYFSSSPLEHVQMHHSQIIWYVKPKASYQTIPHVESCWLVLMNEVYSPDILQCHLPMSRIIVWSQHHWACHFLLHQCSVHSFNNSILLWGIWFGIFAFYATFLAKLIKILSTEFTTVVGP